MLEGAVLFALIRPGTEEDRRPRKPVPPFVFEAYIRGFKEPIIRIRIPEAKGGACARAALRCFAAPLRSAQPPRRTR